MVKALKTDGFQITLSGAGDLSLEDLAADDLHLRMSGAGSVDASGHATRIDARLSGLGSYNGGALQSETADVTISGTGSATVRATRHLDAQISGVGSVKYYGQLSK